MRWNDDIDALFSYSVDPLVLDDEKRKDIIKKIDKIKILDPACGSGAFPMWALNKLSLALFKLDSSGRLWKERQEERARKDAAAAFTIDDQRARDAKLKEISDIFEFNKSEYGHKLYLIQNCMFGVDIQPIAIQITKLRFFISLIVEQERNDSKPNFGIRALPNLETKFVAANTLIGLAEKNKELLGLEDENVQAMKKELWDIRERHFYAKNAKKKKDLRDEDEKKRDQIKQYLLDTAAKPNVDLIRINAIDIANLESKRKEVEKEKITDVSKDNSHFFDDINSGLPQYADVNADKRASIDADIKSLKDQIEAENNKSGNKSLTDDIQKIAGWDPYDQSAKAAQFFDPYWMFGISNGFDVVIGNPPYVSAPTMVDTNPHLRQAIIDSKRFVTLYQKWDLYIPFMELGIQLLAQNGQCTMIVPYPLTNQTYAKKLREFIVNQCSLIEIVDLNGTKVFENATVSNCIPFISKSLPNDSCFISHINDNKDIKRSFYKAISDMVQDEKTAVWNLSKEKRNTGRHSEMNVLGDFCYISYGLRPNSDEKIARGEFVKRDLISETYNSIHCRKYIEAKDIERYRVKRIRYLEYNTERSPDKLVRPTFREFYEHSKLMANRLGDLQVFFDKDKKFLHNDSLIGAVLWKDLKGINNKSISASVTRYSRLSRKEMEVLSEQIDLRYALGLLNSKYASVLLSNIRGGDYHIYPEYLRNLPVPAVSASKQQPVIALVDKILAAKAKNSKADTAAFEEEIDNLVYRLYNLTHDEVKVIEPGFPVGKAEWGEKEIK
jgi:adenine-specific DNA-methyltransferase